MTPMPNWRGALRRKPDGMAFAFVMLAGVTLFGWYFRRRK